MNLSEYLKNHTFEDLHNEYHIKANLDDNRTKLSLDYEQYKSPKGIKLVEECRGLVIRPNISLKSDDWNKTIVSSYKVLARPMLRFYNIQEPEHNIDFDSIKYAFDKLDGTCCILYYDDYYKEYCVATRRCPEAENVIDKNQNSFTSLFWEGVKNYYSNYNDFINKLNKNNTYVFELTSSYNKHVVRYNRTNITLLAVIETSTGKEFDIFDVDLNVDRPKTYKFTSKKQILNFVENFNPFEFEGVVLVDKDFNRVKVKSSAYMLAHYMKNEIETSPRMIVKGIISGDIETALNFVDDDSRLVVSNYKKGYNDLINRMNYNFQDWLIKSKGDRKQFAKIVNSSGEWIKPYFNLFTLHKNNKLTTIKESISLLLKGNKLTNNDLDLLDAEIKRISN